MSFADIWDLLNERVKERSRNPKSYWRKFDSVGIVSSLRGFIDYDSSGHATFVDSLSERRAALEVPIIMRANFSAGVILIPGCAADHGFPQEWDEAKA